MKKNLIIIGLTITSVTEAIFLVRCMWELHKMDKEISECADDILEKVSSIINDIDHVVFR